MRPRKIIVFGSAARGDLQEGSDIDICIIKETSDRLKTKRQLRRLLWKHNVGFEPKIDLHVYPQKVYEEWHARNDPFIEEIEKGQVLYERQ